MAKSQKAKAAKEKLDLDPDAWPKFEKLIKSAAKMGPKPHAAEQKKSKKKSK